jgi:5-methylcytosine-specific restriction enzyme subunit McrC
MGDWEREKVGVIPVKNLWLLMLYASDYRYLSEHLSDSTDYDALELVGRVMCDLLEQRVRRELSKSFVDRHNERSRVRGRIDALKSERTMSLQRGKVWCNYEEVSVDYPRNQFVLSALDWVQTLTSNVALQSRCRSLTHYLHQLGVSKVSGRNKYRIAEDRFGRHEAEDRKIAELADLIHNMMLIGESEGNHLLPMPVKQEQWVRKLFEKAVAGYYKLSLPSKGWTVISGKQLRWQVEKQSARISTLLPMMEVDIQLDNPKLEQRIIIDTKFTNIVTKGRYDNTTFKSGYIYQIYSYIMSQLRPDDNLSQNASGMLLHPSIGVDYDEFALIQGHQVRFCTVDLMASPWKIERRLRELVQP